MATMNAIRIHEYGGPEVLRYEPAPLPEPGAGEVLVRVAAAGVNPFDLKLRGGVHQAAIPLSLPWIPGLDFSGVVTRVGGGVADLDTGAEVFGKSDTPRDGSYAEHVVVGRSGVAARPSSIDHLHAAAVPLAALTAWQSLFGDDRGPALGLRAGQTVLILGAAGGVGSFAVQFAKARGARVVATARRTAEIPHLSALGGDAIIDLERRGLQDAGPVDAVLDLVGGDLQRRAWAQIRPGGALASTVGRPPEELATARGVRAVAVSSHTNAKQLGEIAVLIDAQKVRVVVGETMPLASARRAHERLQSGDVRGKLVLTVGGA